jgi:hypothetical protein
VPVLPFGYQPSSSHHPSIIQPSSSHHPAIIHPSSSHHPAIIHPSSSHHPVASNFNLNDSLSRSSEWLLVVSLPVISTEYDQIIPRTKSSPVPQRVLNHNSRSKSLPRNAGTKCISSSSLDDKKKMASLSRGGKLVRNSSPAAPVFDWSQGHHMTEASTNGESSLQASAIAMATEHPLHHTAKRGKSLDKYKRHSTDDNLLNKASNLGLGNKSEDSGIIMVDYDDGGTLV